MNKRFDLIFSYWIFAWFIFFLLLGSKYIISPFTALLISIIENSFMFLIMILYKVKSSELLFFLIINFLIKILPILYLFYKREYPSTIFDIYKQTIWFVFLFVIYYLWLRINGHTILSNIIDFKNKLQKRSVIDKMPGSQILQSLNTSFQRCKFFRYM
jgi:hypothetical protein